MKVSSCFRYIAPVFSPIRSMASIAFGLKSWIP